MKIRAKQASYHPSKNKPFFDSNSLLESQSKDLMKIRSRIFKVLDEQFHDTLLMVQKQVQIERLKKDDGVKSRVIINESKLEEWVQMFRHEILTIKQDKNSQSQQDDRNAINNIVKLPKPHSEDMGNNLLCCVDENNLNVFEHNPAFNDEKQAWKHTPYSFRQGVIKSHCSITPIPNKNELIIIGGSKPTNPNIKSSKIQSLNLTTQKLQTLANLPYGLSSHCSVYHQSTKSIYIVGGNRNHSIITRGCFRLNLTNKKVEQISCLNYPVSSTTCLIWKQQWIYKFGGVGQAFGEWNTSPYIERYSIELNEWQVINPSIGSSISQGLPLHHMFLAHSSAYVCEEDDRIFVFGGYSIEGDFKNLGFLLKIQSIEENQLNRNQENDSKDKHVIEDFGRLDIQCEGEIMNKMMVASNSLNQPCLYAFTLCNQTGNIEPILVHSFPS